MNELREHLHQLVDQLPDQELEHAKSALVYCANPGRQRMTIDQAERRAKETFERQLRRHAESTGQGYIGSAVGGGSTYADGSHHCSMPAFEEGKEARYHLHIYRGTMFEIVETMEISEDGKRLIRRERITGSDGREQTLTAELPASRADGPLNT